MIGCPQQAARGLDVIQLVETLGLHQPIVGGFDWGGNACCVAAALWPDQLGALVSYAGYDIIDVERQQAHFHPSLERVCWYQHLFQTERGRTCLTEHRKKIAHLLWQEWSPNWNFDKATFLQTAEAFDNPDFVDVVIQAYRSMFGISEGDPALQHLDDRLSARPQIHIPTITIDGAADPLKPGGTAFHASMFTKHLDHWTTPCGHDVPQEAPGVFANAVLRLHDKMAPGGKGGS